MNLCTKLSASSRLLLIEINNLCKKEGHCWASNQYLSDSLHISLATIKRSLSNLHRHGLISIVTTKLFIKWDRKIFISDEVKEMFTKGHKIIFTKAQNALVPKAQNALVPKAQNALVPKAQNALVPKAHSNNFYEGSKVTLRRRLKSDPLLLSTNSNIKLKLRGDPRAHTTPPETTQLEGKGGGSAPCNPSPSLFFGNVELSEEEHRKLLETYGQEVTAQFIEELDDYSHRRPDKFSKERSHYHVLKKWIKRERTMENNQKLGQTPPKPRHLEEVSLEKHREHDLKNQQFVEKIRLQYEGHEELNFWIDGIQYWPKGNKIGITDRSLEAKCTDVNFKENAIFILRKLELSPMALT